MVKRWVAQRPAVRSDPIAHGAPNTHTPTFTHLCPLGHFQESLPKLLARVFLAFSELIYKNCDFYFYKCPSWLIHQFSGLCLARSQCSDFF